MYRGLTEALPYHRLFNPPIAEAAIIGTAIGYAMCGGRVIPEIMYCDFLGCCGDEIFNQLPKWQAMSGNILKMPVVVRVSVGSKYGAQHSQDWTSLCTHIPGLKVVFPVTPYDAKGMMNAALQGTDPVIFFESQRIYDKGEEFHQGGVPEGYYEIPLGEPDVKREGKDVTFLTIGATLYRALQAADELKEKYGLEAEVIDARSLVPFNYEKVIASVKKTGRIIIAGDASARGSYLNDLAANIAAGLQEIIAFQRSLIRSIVNEDVTQVPQTFIPYKEVLDAYNTGMNVPDDVTLTWVDDNHGFIRQMPTETEQQRAGSHGIYYHLSYYGAPQDYLWLSSIGPAQISYELTRGYEQGIQRLWIINVGDIKPAEAELQFCMDLAWDVDAWNPENANQWNRHWAAENFGEEVADGLAEVKKEYYRLAAGGKPEHVMQRGDGSTPCGLQHHCQAGRSLEAEYPPRT